MATATSILVSRCADRLLAVHPSRFRAALEGAAVGVELMDEAPAPEPQTQGRIAVVPVKGPIFATGDWITRLFGWADHAWLQSTAEALAADPEIRGVVLDIDSPGGDVQGMFEAAGAITALASVKPVYAVANHNAYSAAYAIAASASQVYVTQAGGAGSIGVVATHVDRSAMDRELGLTITHLHHGARKVDGTPHAPLSDRARETFQAEVDALGEAFIQHVAAGRGLTPDAVRGQEAATYTGQAAIDAGLADHLGGLDAAIRAMRDELDQDDDPNTAGSPFGARRPWLRSA